MNFKRDLFIHAYEILDGVPERMLDLAFIGNGVQTKPDCGTIACGLGMLAMHPDFNALGFRMAAVFGSEGKEKWNTGLAFEGEIYEPAGFAVPAAHLFGIDTMAAHHLFKPNRSPAVTDKQELLRRMREYLAERDAEVTPA